MTYMKSSDVVLFEGSKWTTHLYLYTIYEPIRVAVYNEVKY